MFSVPVPNHLDVEDTFVFGLSMRQCLLLFLGAVSSSLLYLTLLDAIPDPGLAVTTGAAGALLFFGGILLAALLRVGGRWIEEWGVVTLLYLSRPRIALWRFAPPEPEPRRAGWLGRATRQPPTREEDEAW